MTSAPAVPLYALAPITPRPAEIPLYSTVSAEALDTTGLDAGYWVRNLRRTVRFEQAVRALLADGHDAFVEVSPHPVLTFGVQETIDDTAAAADDWARCAATRAGYAVS